MFALGIMPRIRVDHMQIRGVVVPKSSSGNSKAPLAAQISKDPLPRHCDLLGRHSFAVLCTGWQRSPQPPTGSRWSGTGGVDRATFTAGTRRYVVRELVTQPGIGNGMSLLIFASIVSRVPRSSLPLRPSRDGGTHRRLAGRRTAVHRLRRTGQRRTPVQFANVSSGDAIGGQSTYIPLKSPGRQSSVICASAVLTPLSFVRRAVRAFRNWTTANRISPNRCLVILFGFFVSHRFRYSNGDHLRPGQAATDRSRGLHPRIRNRPQTSVTRAQLNANIAGGLFIAAIRDHTVDHFASVPQREPDVMAAEAVARLRLGNDSIMVRGARDESTDRRS